MQVNVSSKHRCIWLLRVVSVRLVWIFSYQQVGNRRLDDLIGMRQCLHTANSSV